MQMKKETQYRRRQWLKQVQGLGLLALGFCANPLSAFAKKADADEAIQKISGAAAVKEELDEFLASTDLVLDGGASEVGLESTIIDCTGDLPRILRPGAITIEMIEEVTGLTTSSSNNKESVDAKQDHIRVSGSLENHYAPKAKVFLDQKPVLGSGFIAFSNIETPDGVVRLAAPKTIEEFARVIYSALREGDHQNLDSIYIAQPTGDGLAIAIRDRLSRSAKGR